MNGSIFHGALKFSARAGSSPYEKELIRVCIHNALRICCTVKMKMLIHHPNLMQIESNSNSFTRMIRIFLK